MDEIIERAKEMHTNAVQFAHAADSAAVHNNVDLAGARAQIAQAYALCVVAGLAIAYLEAEANG